MSNRVYQADHNGYCSQKSDLNNREKWKWSYENMPKELCELSDEEKELQEYMEQKRDLLASCSMRCPYQKPLFPPMDLFVKQKELIESHDLFLKVFQKMPKGGLLHVHGGMALSIRRLIDVMLRWNKEMPDQERKIRIVTQKIPGMERRYAIGTLLFSYQAGEFRKYTSLLHKYLDKKEHWEKIIGMLTLSCSELDDSPAKWDEYNMIFSRTMELFCDKEFYTRYYEAFFEECISDRIRYVELRCGFEKFVQSNGNGYQSRNEDFQINRSFFYKDLVTVVDPVQPDAEFIAAIMEAYHRVKNKHPQKKFHVRLILVAQRNLNPYVKEEWACICRRVDAAITLKEMYEKQRKEIVIGFDLVGAEDGNCRLDYYARKMIYRPFGHGYSECSTTDERRRIERIDFFLHAGETNWYFNNNVKSAAVFSKYRIGHGCNINQMSEVLEAMLEGPQKMLLEPVVEVCPIFEQAFGYCRDLRQHPIYPLVKNGVMCVIGNDSPQITGNSGLSFDLWEIYVATGIPLQAIKMMIFISYLYEYTAYTTGCVDVKAALAAFTKEWQEFMSVVKDII